MESTGTTQGCYYYYSSNVLHAACNFDNSSSLPSVIDSGVGNAASSKFKGIIWNSNYSYNTAGYYDFTASSFVKT